MGHLKLSHSSGLFNITMNLIFVYMAGDFNAKSTCMFHSCAQDSSKPQSMKSLSSDKQDKDLKTYSMLTAFLGCFPREAMRTF